MTILLLTSIFLCGALYGALAFYAACLLVSSGVIASGMYAPAVFILLCSGALCTCPAGMKKRRWFFAGAFALCIAVFLGGGDYLRQEQRLPEERYSGQMLAAALQIAGWGDGGRVLICASAPTDWGEGMAAYGWVGSVDLLIPGRGERLSSGSRKLRRVSSPDGKYELVIVLDPVSETKKRHLEQYVSGGVLICNEPPASGVMRLPCGDVFSVCGANAGVRTAELAERMRLKCHAAMPSGAAEILLKLSDGEGDAGISYEKSAPVQSLSKWFYLSWGAVFLFYAVMRLLLGRKGGVLYDFAAFENGISGGLVLWLIYCSGVYYDVFGRYMWAGVFGGLFLVFPQFKYRFGNLPQWPVVLLCPVFFFELPLYCSLFAAVLLLVCIRAAAERVGEHSGFRLRLDLGMVTGALCSTAVFAASGGGAAEGRNICMAAALVFFRLFYLLKI